MQTTTAITAVAAADGAAGDGAGLAQLKANNQWRGGGHC